MNSRVDIYLDKTSKWQKEMAQLRKIMLDCHLTEDLKWGKPCYSFENSNIVIIQGFKEYLAVLFFKGVLLSDPKGVLIKTGENTHVGRQMRFNDVKEIREMAPILKAYIYEAIELEEAGVKVKTKARSELILPEEFQHQLDKDPALKKAFYALTPGRQRAYNIYFSAPKQSKTRESRIEKYIQQILDGKGMNDE